MRHCEELHPLQCWYSLSFCAILWQSTFVVCLCWYALLQPATKLYCGRSSRRGIGAGCIPYCLGCPSSGWRVYLVFSHLPLTAPHRSAGIIFNTRDINCVIAKNCKHKHRWYPHSCHAILWQSTFVNSRADTHDYNPQRSKTAVDPHVGA